MTLRPYTTTLLLLCMYVSSAGQGSDLAQRRGLESMAARYLSTFTSLQYPGLTNKAAFLSLFDAACTDLTNDYCRGTYRFVSALDYYEDITAFFIDNPAVKVRSIWTSAPSQVLYGQQGDRYYIWLYKSFEYDRKSVVQYYCGWQRLEVVWLGPTWGYRIIAIKPVVNPPSDSDGDQIPDQFDDCPGTAKGKPTTITGCLVRDR